MNRVDYQELSYLNLRNLIENKIRLYDYDDGRKRRRRRNKKVKKKKIYTKIR